jgi:hypothetical protein
MAARRPHLLRPAVGIALVVGIAGIAASTADASQLIDRNATSISLRVDRKGEALITYRAGGKLRHVLAWGAVNAIAPTPDRAQVAFKLDYAGGWGKYRRDYWQTFANVCRPYTGPALAWSVAACTAPDGSHWALQAWQRELPNFGVAPTPTQAVWELRLSHWTGALPVLDVQVNWAYRRFDHLFGTFTYNGARVYGFRSTSGGNPLDGFGRNIYLDTFDSAYGAGWRRENSFLTHRSTGAFCYGFYPHGPHPAGNGQRYRATVEGPGVAPDVLWEGSAPGAFDAGAQVAADEQILGLGDSLCKPV